MKRIFITIFAFSVMGSVSAQKSEMTGAGMALKELNINQVMMVSMTGDKAAIDDLKAKVLKTKEYMDQCLTKNKETGLISKEKDVAKMHYYAGQANLLYVAMGAADKDIENDVTANEAKYNDLVAGSFKRSLEASDYYKDEITQSVRNLNLLSRNAGVELYNAADFTNAYHAFSEGADIMLVLGITDTLSMYNAGLSADKADMYDEAYKYYSQCAVAGYGGDAKIHQLMIQLVNRKNGNKPSEETLKIITEGKKKYPTDKFLIIEEFNYHYLSGDSDKAQASLQEAIAVSPNDPILHFNIGATFDDMAAARHTAKDHAAAQEYANKAVEAYKKAIQLNAGYFDAYYNLGALYNNESYEKTNMIQEIKDVALYEKEANSAKELLKSAVPYLEKAHELQANDVNTLKILKSIYFNIEDDAKYDAVKAKLEALEQ